MKPRDLDARLAWARKRLLQRLRKPLARHAGEAMTKPETRRQEPVAPSGRPTSRRRASEGA